MNRTAGRAISLVGKNSWMPENAPRTTRRLAGSVLQQCLQAFFGLAGIFDVIAADPQDLIP